MEHIMKVTNPDTLEVITVTVQEGPIPYTVQVTFGPHYSIIMSNEQASKLGLFLRVTGVEF